MTASVGKLTDPPKNLKEAIDWVLCMSGNDVPSHYNSGKEAIKKLAEKLKLLLGSVSVDNHSTNDLFKGDIGLGRDQNHRPIESLCLGLKQLIKHPNGMGLENYAYSYSDENPSTTVDNDKSPKMFLGVVPLLFLGLGFIYWKCKGGWKNLTLGSDPLKTFMDSLGFTGQLDTSQPASKAGSWFTMFDEFKRVDSVNPTFHQFLKNVELVATNFKNVPNTYPLYTLYRITYQYLKTKTQNTLSTTVYGIPTSDDITLFNELSTAMGKLGISQSDKLSSAYTQLGNAIILALKTPDPVEESSVAGPVTGTLATAGLLGGGSAVYFNVGGAGTFLKGIFNIR
ncbi:variant erythrocyte surface antigen-1 family protein [Babesia caballi]|uniref:Variant erythrocyte surface antigen-1 family protein n=1 Tax=Babesia caballi TaxID=5871 RepID=A0AAV4LNR5_BABCB|nr:variant erythrocyte surface antigen-1 family protein [Babesia caballi]